MKRLILVFFVLIFYMSCKDASKKKVIKRDDMVSLLTDIHLVDGYLAGVAEEKLKQEAANYYNLVYKRHSTDSIQFKISLKYYSKDPVLLDSMYSEIIAKLDKLYQLEEKRAEQKRLDIEKYNLLKAETNGTLFKPYDIWFYKFAEESINGIYSVNAIKSPPKRISTDTVSRIDSTKTIREKRFRKGNLSKRKHSKKYRSR